MNEQPTEVIREKICASILNGSTLIREAAEKDWRAAAWLREFADGKKRRRERASKR